MLIKIVDDDQTFAKKIKDIVYDAFKNIFIDYSIECISSNFEYQYFEEGDIFFLHVLGETLCYRVGEITTVLPEDTEELVIESGKDLVTLITCTPYGINTHRLCVEGYRIPYTEEVLQEAAAQAESSRLWLFLQDWGWIPVSLVLIAVMCIMLWRYNRK